MTVEIPIHIRRAVEPGPVVFVTAALHGDEINGTGAVREMIQDPTFELQRGAVIMVPVLNLLAFDRHSRYLPDRRDLNRSFPWFASRQPGQPHGPASSSTRSSPAATTASTCTRPPSGAPTTPTSGAT